MTTRYLLAALCIAISPLTLAQDADSGSKDKESVTVYRYVDDNGQVVYTNEPREGAESLEVEMPNTMDSKEPIQRQTRQQNDQADSYYRAVQIRSPQAEETVRNTGGVVEVSYSAQPGLLDGHRYRVSVADRTIETRSNSMTLEEVPRGIHTIQVDILNGDGEVVFSGEPQEFYVKQHSALH